MSRSILNRPGPHRRDYDRLARVAVACGLDADSPRTANTGTVYLAITREDGEERVYRFASHGECYSSHDYSVLSPWNGGLMPPGYDGSTNDAIEDLVGWAGVADQPPARRAIAAIQRSRAKRAAEAQRVARARAEAEAQRVARARAEAAGRRRLARALLIAADQMFPEWTVSDRASRISRAAQSLRLDDRLPCRVRDLVAAAR